MPLIHILEEALCLPKLIIHLSLVLGERGLVMLLWGGLGSFLVFLLWQTGMAGLFFGADFLLKYAAEHSHISIEVRMLSIVLLACTMIGFGWYLSASRMIYALALQGGGLGNIFSFKLSF